MARRKPPLPYVWCPFCTWVANVTSGGAAREALRGHIESECPQVIHPHALDRIRERAEEIPEAVERERLACAHECVLLFRRYDGARLLCQPGEASTRRKLDAKCEAAAAAERAIRVRGKSERKR